MKHIKLFEAFGHSAVEKVMDPKEFGDGARVTYSVRYERKAEDGDYENETKDFDDVAKALAFAKEKYSSVEFSAENAEGELLASGYVSVKDGKLYGVKTPLGLNN